MKMMQGMKRKKFKRKKRKKEQLIENDYSLKDSFEMRDLLSLVQHVNIFAFLILLSWAQWKI